MESSNENLAAAIFERKIVVVNYKKKKTTWFESDQYLKKQFSDRKSTFPQEKLKKFPKLTIYTADMIYAASLKWTMFCPFLSPFYARHVPIK